MSSSSPLKRPQLVLVEDDRGVRDAIEDYLEEEGYSVLSANDGMAAGIAKANPQMSLRAIGAQLEAMRERTPRGGRQWAASSVKNLLDQAEKLGLTSSTVRPTD